MVHMKMLWRGNVFRIIITGPWPLMQSFYVFCDEIIMGSTSYMPGSE